MSDHVGGAKVAEEVPVILARMEGKLDRVQDRVTELVPRVSGLEVRTSALEVTTLILSKNADAEEDKKIALALALKEADETRRNQSEQSWTPIQRFFATITALTALASLIIYFYSVAK
jgi:hypothetical protein